MKQRQSQPLKPEQPPFVTESADWKHEYRIPERLKKVYRPEGDLRGETGVSSWFGASGNAPYVLNQHRKGMNETCMPG